MNVHHAKSSLSSARLGRAHLWRYGEREYRPWRRRSVAKALGLSSKVAFPYGASDLLAALLSWRENARNGAHILGGRSASSSCGGRDYLRVAKLFLSAGPFTPLGTRSGFTAGTLEDTSRSIGRCTSGSSLPCCGADSPSGRRDNI